MLSKKRANLCFCILLGRCKFILLVFRGNYGGKKGKECEDTSPLVRDSPSNYCLVLHRRSILDSFGFNQELVDLFWFVGVAMKIINNRPKRTTFMTIFSDYQDKLHFIRCDCGDYRNLPARRQENMMN
ncbi:hypothetical protein QN277_027411 [Acacia crassicarpa]|uniref:Uncharacterized protein n=1 Tax=Acacia crassicarpa TaxID=499986 RepID=A0AAE1JEC1_9FABA|nr:hypothetical protein QN277_027411 [Acacia crassicarpa]